MMTFNLTYMDMTKKHNDDVAYFIAFCIETYKNTTGLTGGEVSLLFSDTGLIEFLANNFEPLHTQSPQWIMEEINDYLSTHK